MGGEVLEWEAWACPGPVPRPSLRQWAGHCQLYRKTGRSGLHPVATPQQATSDAGFAGCAYSRDSLAGRASSLGGEGRGCAAFMLAFGDVLRSWPKIRMAQRRDSTSVQARPASSSRQCQRTSPPSVAATDSAIAPPPAQQAYERAIPHMCRARAATGRCWADAPSHGRSTAGANEGRMAA